MYEAGPPPASTAEAFSKQIGYIPKIFQNEGFRAHSNLPRENPTITPVRYKILHSGTTTSQYGSIPDVFIGETFSAGSTPASVFNLCSAILGAGCLALPFCFQLCGVFASGVLLLVAMVAANYSIQLLCRCRDATCLSSYEDLATFCFGPCMAVFVELNIILFCFGCCVAYVMAAGDILSVVAAQYLPSLLADRVTIMIVFVACVMLPISFVETLGALRYASLFGVGAIVFLVGATVVESLRNFGLHNGAELFKVPTGTELLTAMPIVFFAFNCQVNIFSIYTELQRPSIAHMSRVVRWAMATCFLLYFTIGFFGYAQFGENTQANVLYNFDLSVPALVVAQAFVGVAVTLAYPLNIVPARFAFDMLFCRQLPPSSSRSALWTLSIVLGSLVCAIFLPGIATVFALLGGTTSVVLCFLLPAAFYIRLFPSASTTTIPSSSSAPLPPPNSFSGGFSDTNNDNNNNTFQRVAAWSLLVFGLVVGFGCNWVNIAYLLNPPHPETVVPL